MHTRLVILPAQDTITTTTPLAPVLRTDTQLRHLEQLWRLKVVVWMRAAGGYGIGRIRELSTTA